ncbi:hypothetical protein LJR225_003796 [Phenylobacterium sp. LjRoot225]|uniref:hypothetical protein n=1 Tax=Phenylobacterium sp. LjRoot225 TaxID=3342285 RepID=UPI003ECDE678
MSAATSRLPSGFEALEPFADAWAVEGANNRLQRRLTSSEAEQVAFFNAAKDLLPAALTYLDRKPLGQFDAVERRLMNLFLTFAHVSLAVETQGDDEPKHAEGARHITITRAPADRHP